jgi:tetratricopeptide (TPR) repeat protein
LTGARRDGTLPVMGAKTSRNPAASGAKAAPRRWLFRLAAIFLGPLLGLAALEGALRLAGYGHPTSFFLKERAGGRDYFVNNDDFVLRFFPPDKSRQPRPVMMEAEKPAGDYRIFVMGESAALGDPDPAFGAPRFLEALLRERFPALHFEFVNTAITAINSHAILPIARECARRQGDLWIIYMGNNEMVGPFGAASVFGSQAPPWPFVRLSLAAQTTRLGQGLMALARRWRDQKPGAKSWGGLEMFLQNRVPPGDPRKEIVYKNFQRNLDDILGAGLDSGARIILNTVAVNLRDCPPLASADDGKSGAGAEYQLAENLLRAGNAAEARPHFVKARDLDALPARADSRVNDMIRGAAHRLAAPGLVLFDAAELMGSNFPAGICGSETFYEHVHFNGNGNYRLARAWAERVEEFLPAEARQRAAGSWLSKETCEKRIGFTDWNRRNVLAEVLRRRQRPPLFQQSNNAAQAQLLRQEIAALNQRMDAADAAEARATYADAIARAPSDLDLYSNFADFLEAIGAFQEGVAEWQKVEQLRPSFYVAYFQEGRLRERLGDLAAARASFARTLSLHPRMAPAWYEMSNIDASQGRFDSALKEIDHAAKLEPAQGVFQVCAGKLLSKMNRPHDALARYRRAVEVQPYYVEGHLALAAQLAADGKTSGAKDEFRAVLRLDPANKTARASLGE